jgi:hypothetical protein
VLQFCGEHAAGLQHVEKKKQLHLRWVGADQRQLDRKERDVLQQQQQHSQGELTECDAVAARLLSMLVFVSMQHELVHQPRQPQPTGRSRPRRSACMQLRSPRDGLPKEEPDV